MKQFALFLILSLGSLAVASGSWMRQVNGSGAGTSQLSAERAATRNLEDNLEEYQSLCRDQGGQEKIETGIHPICRQTILDWKCTAIGKITCYFR